MKVLVRFQIVALFVVCLASTGFARQQPVPATPPAPSGTAPARRRAHTAIFDAPRDRMIVFGGVGFDAGRSAFWPDDSAAVWSLSLSGSPEWSVVETPQALLSRRFAHAVAHDPTRDRMWVYGGADQIGSLNFSPGLYYLDLAGTVAWTRVARCGTAYMRPMKSRFSAIERSS